MGSYCLNKVCMHVVLGHIGESIYQNESSAISTHLSSFLSVLDELKHLLDI